VAEIQRCAADPERLLVVEANRQLPRTLGLPPEHPHVLEIGAVDVLIEVDRPPFSLEDPQAGDVEKAMAAAVSRYVPDGATLQTGIGGVPSEVVEILADGPGGDYGVHSEMYTTGLMKLQRAGKVSNRKGVFDGFSVATFAAGTRALYDWLDGNAEVRFLPVGVVNDPAVVARNRRMVSINGALAVDLLGQLAADAIGGRQYSGIGGHEDFTMAASAAPGGRSLVCLPSTARVEQQQVSRIVAAFEPGTPVTTPRHHADVVITEYGAAELSGRTVAERARALLAIAHPEHRDALLEQAERLQLLAPATRPPHAGPASR
jgi:acyl-CoA hydrolase